MNQHFLSHCHHRDYKPNLGQPREIYQNRVCQVTKGFCLRGFGGSRHQRWSPQVTRSWQSHWSRSCQLRGPWASQQGGSWCQWTSHAGTIGRSQAHPEKNCRWEYGFSSLLLSCMVQFGMVWCGSPPQWDSLGVA